MTDSVLTPKLSDCQFQKFIQAGLFSCDADVVLLTRKEKQAAYKKAWSKDNPEKKKASAKAYQKANPEKRKAYRAAHPGKSIATNKTWRAANFEKVNATNKAWLIANPEKVKARVKKNNSASVRYDVYRDRLQNYENILQDSDGILLVGCVYCGKQFTPTKIQVDNRISAINGTQVGENRFYCSQLCKIACPIYRQQIRYKFQQVGHTREVPAEFRQMVLLNRNYTCENCDSDETGLHVHHINGYTESPMTMADLSNVKVLCANCHKAVHSIPGCYFVDYSCKNQKQ